MPIFREIGKRLPSVFRIPLIHLKNIGFFGWKKSKTSELWVKHQRKKTNIRELKKCRRSDTLFILGSGSSVNELEPSQWEHISKCDSVGLNFWILHDFVPTYYQFETPSTSGPKKYFEETMRKRKHDYRSTQILAKIPQGLADNFEALLEFFPTNIWFPKYQKIPGHYERDIKLFYKLIGRLKIWNYSSSLYHQVGSISDLTYLGFFLGYSKIVLVGVDLNNNRYFWQSSDSEHASFNNGQRGETHKTFDKSKDGLTIDKVLEPLSEYVLTPNGVSLFVASRSSALYPRFPSYFDKILE